MTPETRALRSEEEGKARIIASVYAAARTRNLTCSCQDASCPGCVEWERAYREALDTFDAYATRLRAAAGEGEGEDAKSGAGRNERALERWWPTVNSRLSFSAMPPICRDFARWLDAEAAERKRAVLLRAAREVPDVG